MDTTIITFMKTCQLCVLTLAKSPLFVMIFFMFAQNPVGNLIFRMTSFTTLLCCSISIHGSEFILIWSMFLWNWMTYFIACRCKFWQFFCSHSFHPISVIMFQPHSFRYALYQTYEQFVGSHSRETYWIV